MQRAMPMCESNQEPSSECLPLINPEQTERDDHALDSIDPSFGIPRSEFR